MHGVFRIITQALEMHRAALISLTAKPLELQRLGRMQKRQGEFVAHFPHRHPTNPPIPSAKPRFPNL